jgi:hypothetical protein
MITPGKAVRALDFQLRTRAESYRHSTRLKHIEATVAKHEPATRSDNAPVVFFNASTRTWGITLNAAFSMLASWGFRLAGMPVRYYVCHAGLEGCMIGTIRKRPLTPPPCNVCCRLSRMLYPGNLQHSLRAPKDGWDSISEIEGDSIEALRQVTAGSVPLGELCLPSLRWVLRKHNVVDSPEIVELFRRYLRSAAHLAKEFDRFLSETKPRALVVFNGVTFPEAVARHLALERGIPVITHEVGVQPLSAFFTHGHATAYPIDIEDDFALDAGDEARLDSYLVERFQGQFTMAGVRFWPEIRSMDEALLGKITQHKQTVAVFTNVIFDTSQMHANTVFSDMFVWLEGVVELARERKDTLFVIRAHPDELRPGKESQETVAEALQQSGAIALPNIVFIPSDQFLNSYELIEKSKLVLVYNSSIGLEATLLYRVVLSGGASRYTRYPTVYFPDTPEAYFQLARRFLEQEKPRPPKEFILQARRFSYVQHFLTSLDFSDYLEPHPHFPGYVSFGDFDPLDLHPDRCLEVRILERGILENRQMFYDRADVAMKKSPEAAFEEVVEQGFVEGDR